MEPDYFSSIGKLLIVIGVISIVVGGAFLLLHRLPFRVGRMPGDILYKRGNFTFYFPWVTSIVLSLLLTLVLWLVNKR